MIRNLLLLLLAIVASISLLPLAFIRNLSYRLKDVVSLSRYIYAMGYGIDVMAASVVFGRTYKTVSGMTGRKSDEERKAKHTSSYIYPLESLINWLFNDPMHCQNAYRAEYPEDF